MLQRSDDGDLQPPEGEGQRLINKDAALCGEWRTLVLITSRTYSSDARLYHALIAASCLLFCSVLPTKPVC